MGQHELDVLFGNDDWGAARLPGLEHLELSTGDSSTSDISQIPLQTLPSFQFTRSMCASQTLRSLTLPATQVAHSRHASIVPRHLAQTVPLNASTRLVVFEAMVTPQDTSKPSWKATFQRNLAAYLSVRPNQLTVRQLPGAASVSVQCTSAAEFDQILNLKGTLPTSAEVSAASSTDVNRRRKRDELKITAVKTLEEGRELILDLRSIVPPPQRPEMSAVELPHVDLALLFDSILRRPGLE